MVSFVSNGDLVVQQKNCEACQYLEFFAISITQYCKETRNREGRLYDARGIAISNMANDLKSFVKGYIERDCKKKNYENNVSVSMLINITEALDIFGEVYNSGSCKKYANILKEKHYSIFLYRDIVDSVISSLKKANFIVTRCDSGSTSSVYLDVDYGMLQQIRISDHYRPDFNGIQLIMCDEKIAEAGSNSVYYLRTESVEHDLNKVIGYMICSLKYSKNKIANLKYLESVKERKSIYKEESTKFQEVR